MLCPWEDLAVSCEQCPKLTDVAEAYVLLADHRRTIIEKLEYQVQNLTDALVTRDEELNAALVANLSQAEPASST
jgi:hypothetical protein